VYIKEDRDARYVGYVEEMKTLQLAGLDTHLYEDVSISYRTGRL
jgi:hypothetical protein